MGMVHAAQKGELKDPSSKVAKLAKTMTKKSATEFASTKHKGLPKTAKKTIKENYENKVGSLHVVQKPTEGCSCDGMVYEIDPVYGISKHNLNPDTIHGVYSTPEEAKKVAESLYSDHVGAMKKLEEKKDTVSKKLNTAIDKLEKKRKDHMKMAKEDPKNASTHKANMSQISSQIEDLMDKLEKVSKSKKETEEEDESKKKLNEDKGSDIETLKSILGDLDGGYIKPKNGKFEVRYRYWEELPSSLIKKLKGAGFDYDETDTGSDNGVVYTISKKKEVREDIGAPSVDNYLPQKQLDLLDIILTHVKDTDDAEEYAQSDMQFWPDYVLDAVKRDPRYKEYLKKYK